MNITIISKKHGTQIVHFDKADAPLINKYTWCVASFGRTLCAMTRIGKKTCRMHKMIIKTKKFVDHRDGNALNNRRKNLRITTNSQNTKNRRLSKNNSSGFKGVFVNKKTGKFYVRIGLEFKQINGGTFNTAIEAAKRYNDLAKQHHGEFANLNFIS